MITVSFRGEFAPFCCSILAFLMGLTTAAHGELLSDTDFSTVPSNVAKNTPLTEAHNLDEWYIDGLSSVSQRWLYDSANDELDLNTNGNRYRAIAQIIDDSVATTTGQVEFEMDITYLGDGYVDVQVFGVEDGDMFALRLSGGNNSTSGTDVTTEIDLLDTGIPSLPVTTTATPATLTVQLDLGTTDFHHLLLRINVHSFDTNLTNAGASGPEAITVHSASLASAAIPEPSTLTLATLGLLALLGFTRRRRK